MYQSMRGKGPGQTETLRTPGTAPELRAGKDGEKIKYIRGYGAVFDEWAWIGPKAWGFRERILQGAFANALAERQDIRGLFNHDANYVLGRYLKTMRLKEDDRGLHYDIDNPNSPTINDLVIRPIQREDITGSSFTFMVRPGGAEWRIIEGAGEDGSDIWERDLKDVDVFDLGPVTFPAYEGTEAHIRSTVEEFQKRSIEHRRSSRRRKLVNVRARYNPNMTF